nr:hypothetical protein [Tanacetum cinerariifolium]
MHGRPSGKIGLYTRFFYYDNFRLPLSTFLVDVLRHFRINLSQLSVIGAAKVSHFESCVVSMGSCQLLGYSERYPLIPLKIKTIISSGWMTLLALLFFVAYCQALTRDPDPVAADFNAQDYATLVAHPSPFWKFPEAFLCLVGLSRHYTLDEKTYPRNGYFCFHPYHGSYQIAPDRADSELEASVERLFDEGGSGNQSEQRDSARGGPDANIQPVVEAANIVVEDAAPVQSRRQRKRKFVVVDPGGLSHPPKKLREDHRTLMGPPFDISSDSSHHSGTNVADAEVNPLTRSSVPIMTTVTTTTSTVNLTSVTKEKFVEPSSFGAGSSFAGGTDPIMGVFSDLTVYVPQWSMTNGSRLDDGRVCREMVDEFAPLKFFAAEVRMCDGYNVKEKRRLKYVVKSQGELLKAREEEIKSLKARLLLRKAEAAKAIHLRTKASNFETIEKSLRDETNALRERNVILEKELNALHVKVTELETLAMSKERELSDLNSLVTSVKSQNDSLCASDEFDKLYTDFVEMTLHLEKKFYPHLLTTISGRKWLLTHGMKLVVANCLNSSGYLSALGATIGKVIEKGMQDGLSASITHGKEGRVLLKSSKDASVDTVMDILRLEGPLAEKLGLNELQPNVDQLMVPIHHSPDQVVVGATALSLALDVSSVRVWKIRENIANQRSALRDVFVPLAEPFFAIVLTGTEGTSDTAAITADTTMILSTTFASASTIAPIFVYDYECYP